MYARAAAAAAQLSTDAQDNSLIHAFLRYSQMSTMQSTNSDTTMDGPCTSTLRGLYAELLQPTMAAMLRRMGAGTLLLPTRVEAEWFDKYESCRAMFDGAPSANQSDEGTFRVYLTFLHTASMGWHNLMIGLRDISVESEAKIFEFMAAALDLIGQTTGEDGSPALLFARDGSSPPAHDIEVGLCMMVTPSMLEIFPAGVVQPLLTACERLKASPALRFRGFAERADQLSDGGRLDKGLLKPWAPRRPQQQQPQPRACHFSACDAAPAAAPAKSLKRCGGCNAVFYCCKEHQLADWSAHKAACKAARKGGRGE